MSLISVWFGAMFFLVVPLTADEPALAPELKSLIEKVKAQEALYANHELVLTENYEHLRLEDASPAALSHLVAKKKTEWRIIRQNGMEYVSSWEKGTVADGSKIDRQRVSAYDGKQTRSREDGEVKVYDGLRTPSSAPRAHTLLLGRPRRMSLGEFLGQTKSQHRSPRKIAVTVIGDEKIDGLDCVKVKVEYWRGEEDDPTGCRHVWLAKNRNYFPVMSNSGFAPPFLEEATVLKWSEIKPGIWMPKTIDVASNDWNQAAQGNQVPHTRTEFEIKKVELKPDYPMEFFQKIDPPDQKAPSK